MVSEKHLARTFFGGGSHDSGANHVRNGGIRSVALIWDLKLEWSDN